MPLVSIPVCVVRCSGLAYAQVQVVDNPEYSFIMDANNDGVSDIIIIAETMQGIEMTLLLNKYIAKTDAFFITVNMNQHTPGLSFRCVVTDLQEVKST